jgi:hypothetical protein
MRKLNEHLFLRLVGGSSSSTHGLLGILPDTMDEAVMMPPQVIALDRRAHSPQSPSTD